MDCNVASENEFSISAEMPQTYTATHFFCGIPLIKSVMLTSEKTICGINGNLSVNITAKCENSDILNFVFNIADFHACDYTCVGATAIKLNLEKFKIIPNADFINSLENNAYAKIFITVCIGKTRAEKFADIKISPFGHICPEMPPELICSYVLPDCEFAATAERELPSYAEKAARKYSQKPPKQILHAEALADFMLSAKLTYSSVHNELPDGECIIRDTDSLMESNKKSVSQTEAALIYCSLAERCGLRPGIVFLRRGAGAIKVLIKIGLGNYCAGNAVGESVSQLRKKILNKEIFVFDILELLGTEESDFQKNVTETTALVFKVSSAVAYSVNVYTARLCGVRSLRPFDGCGAKDIYGGYESVSDVVKKIDKNADLVSVYGFSPYKTPSLGLCAASNLEYGKEYAVSALDDEFICSSPDALSEICEIQPQRIYDVHRNITEKTLYNSKAEKLKNKISESAKKGTVYAYPSKYMLCAEKLFPEKIRDELKSDATLLCQTANIASLNCESTTVYAICGTVKLSENEIECFVPCAYIPCKISVETGAIKITYGVGGATPNKSLIKRIAEHTDFEYNIGINSELRQEELKDYISKIKKISQESNGKFVFYSDTFLAAFDISYTLMRNCLERTEGKKFESCLENGKYTLSQCDNVKNETFDSTLPFECSSTVREAVKRAETDSIVISGAHGTGKKKAVANIISRAALAGNGVLVCSKYPESLKSLRNTMRAKGLEELCLYISEEDETKNRILNDIRTLSSKAQNPQKIANAEFSAAESAFNLRTNQIYSEYGFGLSLYDCIEEYCKYDAVCEAPPINVETEICNLSKESVKNIIDISENLAAKAAEISEMCEKSRTDIFQYLKYIKSVKEIPKSSFSVFSETAEKLRIFCEKSAFTKNCLELSDKDMPSVRSLLALGEFSELIVKSGIDFIPNQIFNESVYRCAKNVEDACDLIDELHQINSELSFISNRIASVSCTELYIKWKDSENNLFVRNSIIHEITKYLPADKKISSKETGEILEKLSRREQLEKELSSASSNLSSILGELWNGKNTDTEKARRTAAFAVSADSCIKKLFPTRTAISENIINGIKNLISQLSQNNSHKTDFVLAVSAFKRLADPNNGLFSQLQECLCADLYELKFPNGIMSKNGMCAMLHTFCENIQILSKIHELNILKKDAKSVGLSSFAHHIENQKSVGNESALFKKSVYIAFANYIISSKQLNNNEEDITSKYKKYRDSYIDQKNVAAYNLLVAQRKRFNEYVATENGKKELFELQKSLNNSALSCCEIINHNYKILRVIYSAALVPSTIAYGLHSYPEILVLTDCEKTDAAEGIPLCASFDKCVFITSPFEKIGSIISSLPLEIPTFVLNRVAEEKNGNIAAFANSLFGNSITTLCRESRADTVKFIKCDGGVYDKNNGTNKIEAVQACETALSIAQTEGFQKVGIMAFTAAQAFEITSALQILSKKHRNKTIAKIPVRYIGNMGDFSKEFIVLSVTFGKNIFSSPKSFGCADNISMIRHGHPFVSAELLCCSRELYVVSSCEPEEISTDGLCLGACAIRSVLEFAKYGCLPIYLSNESHSRTLGGIENKIFRNVEISRNDIISHNAQNIIISNGTAVYGNTAIIYDNGYIRDSYERIILPLAECEAKGYNVKFQDICDLLKNTKPTEPPLPSEKRE